MAEVGGSIIGGGTCPADDAQEGDARAPQIARKRSGVERFGGGGAHGVGSRKIDAVAVSHAVTFDEREHGVSPADWQGTLVLHLGMGQDVHVRQLRPGPASREPRKQQKEEERGFHV